MTSSNVDPERRKELFADPPRTPTPAELSDRARHAIQRIRSAKRRALPTQEYDS